MKRYFSFVASVILMLSFIAASRQTTNAGVRKALPIYLVEKTDKDVEIHTSVVLSTIGIDYEWVQGGLSSTATHLMRQFAQVKGLRDIFIMKYGVHFYLLPGTSPDAVVTQAIEILNNLMASRGLSNMILGSVEPGQVQCQGNPRFARKRAAKTATYWIECPPNEQMVSFHMNRTLTREYGESYDGSCPMCTHGYSRLLKALSLIPGVDDVYISKDKATLGKSKAVSWSEIMPKALSILQRQVVARGGALQRVPAPQYAMQYHLEEIRRDVENNKGFGSIFRIRAPWDRRPSIRRFP